ncbi:MAG: iron-containing alcohol dehydrogenase [Treponema sp.]|nr:iron-containing alcohol dehydrogenase [Treponema sp.]
MADFSFKVSPNILVGSYAASRVGQTVASYGSKFMVISDSILRENGTTQKITKALEDKKIEFFIFDELSKGGDSEILERCLKLGREAHIHGVIAVGGGRPMSVGRAVCSLFNEEHDLYDYLDGSVPKSPALPFIAIPTTIRDAFIFTDTIPLEDARSSTLKLLKSQSGIAKLVLFDPTLTSTLTENQMDSMALETLCLAVETYLSQKTNFFSNMITEKAVELFTYALDGSQTLTVTTPKEELLSQAGCLASLSASTSSIGIASLLSMCINARYKISRSLVTTILFPYMVEECAKFKADRISILAKKMGIAQPEQSDEEAAHAFAESIRQRIAKANLPARLKDLSVSLEQLALAAEDAGQLDIVNNLPRSMNSDDLFGMIKTAY